MKIYKNPWVTRESYFVKTGAARSAKMEAAKSTGYSVDLWDGKWKVRKATYYNKSLAEMPVVCENKVSIQAVIGKAVLDAVHGFAGGGKSDGEETPQAGWLPVYESEITGWDPALAGRDPIGGYACSKCGYEAVYSCNDEYVLSNYCPRREKGWCGQWLTLLLKNLGQVSLWRLQSQTEKDTDTAYRHGPLVMAGRGIECTNLR